MILTQAADSARAGSRAPSDRRPLLPCRAVAVDPAAPAPFRRWEVVLPAAAAAVLAGVLLPRGVHVYDDAYITLRYARNVADGAGLVYNAGDAVLGTSAPLWALLLAPLARLLGTGALPAIAVAADLLLLVATAVLAYRILRRSVAPHLAVTATFAALAPVETLRVFVSGMETPLYLAFLLLTFELVLRGRDAAALVLAGLLPFVHPEAGLAVPVALLGIRARDGRWPRLAACAGLLPGALAGLGLTLLFGSPIPHSVTAKRLVYALPPGSGLEKMALALLEPLVPPSMPELLTVVVPLFAAGLVATTLLLGRARLREPRLLLPALFAISYLAFFAVANPRVFPWYDPPLAVAATLLVAGAASGPARRLAPVLSVAFLLAAALHLSSYRPHRSEGREEAYREAATALGAREDEVVAAPEIGAVGFYTRARILDTSGLVSPEAVPFHARLAAARGGKPPDREVGGMIPAGLVEELRPDYLVALTLFVDVLLATSPHALDGYDLVREVPADAFGSRAVLVYRRRG